jgi:uncharacterized caspase-like protein
MLQTNHYALLIGIGNYIPEREGPGNLDSPQNDVTALAAWLTHPNGGGVLPHHCIVITSNTADHPDQNIIDNHLTSLFNQIDNTPERVAERIYFYFSGHGLGLERDTSNTAWCLGAWTELQNNKALASASYRELLKTVRYFREVVFLSDCCRDLSLTAFPAGFSKYQEEEGKVNEEPVLFEGFSCRYRHQSFGTTKSGIAQGIFTRLLLEGLQGAAVDTRSCRVTAESLKRFMDFFLPLRAQQEQVVQSPTIALTDTSFDPMVFGEELPAHIPFKVSLQFKRKREHLVILYNGEAAEIARFMPAEQTNATLDLSPGLYALREEGTLETILLDLLSPSIQSFIF